MKLVHPEYFKPMILTEDEPSTLVIENGRVFRKLIYELLEQCSTDKGDFVLSENDEPMDLSKECIVFTDFFHIDQSNKPMKAKILQMVKEEHNDSEQLREIVTNIHALGFRVCSGFEMPISYNDQITSSDVLKFMDFQLDLNTYSGIERVLEYCSACRELTGQSLFVSVGMKDLLDEEEYENLIEELMYRKLCVLMIERHAHPEMDDPKHLRIIDSDLCEL